MSDLNFYILILFLERQLISQNLRTIIYNEDDSRTCYLENMLMSSMGGKNPHMPPVVLLG